MVAEQQMRSKAGHLLLLSAWACNGVIHDPGANGPSAGNDRPSGIPVPGQAPVCAEGVPPVAAPLVRFGVDEYAAALRGLFGESAVGETQALLDTFPSDEPPEEGFFARQDQRISEQHVSAQFNVADALAQAVTAQADLRERFASECRNADRQCFEAFVPTFLRRALRRAPTEDELSRAMALSDEFGPGDGIHAVVFTTLMSPDFLFRFENRGQVVSDGFVQELTAYELATRLAFHFWSGPPDEALLDAADNGELDTPSGFAAQVNRIYEDPRTARTIEHFFSEWLHLDGGGFEPGPKLDLLRGTLNVDGLADEMRQEVRELLSHYVANGTWDDVLTSRLSFARTARLADIYGVPVWDGIGLPPRLPEERSGLLTRAGMLLSSDGSTNPFRRGVFIRRSMLCDDVPPPPNSLPQDALQPPDLESGASTRAAFEAKVLDEPCATCHAAFSPLGYAFEDFDGLGRYRTEEWVVSDLGEDLGYVAVDATVEAQVDDDVALLTGGAGLSQRVADSRKSSACFSRQYFRFVHRREERPEDACSLQAWTQALEDGATLAEAFRSVVFEPAFRQRLLETEN